MFEGVMRCPSHSVWWLWLYIVHTVCQECINCSMAIIQSSLPSLQLSSPSLWSALLRGQLSPFIPILTWTSALPTGHWGSDGDSRATKLLRPLLNLNISRVSILLGQNPKVTVIRRLQPQPFKPMKCSYMIALSTPLSSRCTCNHFPGL